MSREDVPVRSVEDEALDLFPDRDSVERFDKSDPVNDRAWKGAGEKYAPREPVSKLNIESINSRADRRR
jgi:hypothetical protein